MVYKQELDSKMISSQVHEQDSPNDSPWTFGQRIKMVIWDYIWLLFCSWTPKPANPWRILWLKVFGAQMHGKPFVHQRARIQIPWNLTMHHCACLGDRANAYTLGKIEILEYAIVAQEAYLCTGTHAFSEPAKNLITSPITIGAHVFVGARAFIMPGVTIGDYTVVGACSVVTKSVAANQSVKGNPAR
ncbi:MAG: DapH/DapD/GlmU-related protein [Chitinophagaceae bacterium]